MPVTELSRITSPSLRIARNCAAANHFHASPSRTFSDLRIHTMPSPPAAVRMHVPPAPDMRSEAQVLGRKVLLRNAQAVEVRAMTPDDMDELARFYKEDVPWKDAEEACECHEAAMGIDVRPKFAARARSLLSVFPDDRIMIARAVVDGTPRIVGAGMVFLSCGAYRPSHLLVAPAFQRKGLGTTLKIAQIEYAAEAGGAQVMESRRDLCPGMVKVYEAASRCLGLRMTVDASGSARVELRRGAG